MKKTVISSWIILITSILFFVYNFINNTTLSRFQLFNMQIFEGLLTTGLILTLPLNGIYLKKIKKSFIHLLSICVGFTLISTVKYELDSNFLITVHAICYGYFFVILATIMSKQNTQFKGILTRLGFKRCKGSPFYDKCEEQEECDILG